MCKFSPRRPSQDGTGGVEAWDGLTPLHLACMAGLDKIVQSLVQENAQVNIQVRIALFVPGYFGIKFFRLVHVCVSEKPVQRSLVASERIACSMNYILFPGFRRPRSNTCVNINRSSHSDPTAFESS